MEEKLVQHYMKAFSEIAKAIRQGKNVIVFNKGSKGLRVQAFDPETIYNE